MTPEELAHWRYRVQALEPRVRDSHENEKAARQLSQMCHMFGLDTHQWDEYIEKELEQREPNRWLLEEARYKIELGKVMIGE